MIQKRLRMRIIRLNLIYLLPILLLCCAAVFSGFFALMRRSQVRFLTSESYMSQVYLMDRLGYRGDPEAQRQQLRDTAPLLCSTLADISSLRVQLYSSQGELMADSLPLEPVPATDDVTSAAKGTKAYLFFSRGWGRAYVSFSSPVYSSGGETIGVIRYLTPQGDALLLRGIAALIAALAILASVLCYLVSSALAEIVAKPVLSLQKALGQMEKGESVELTAGAFQGEFRELEQSFLTMEEANRRTLLRLEQEKEKQNLFFNSATHQLKTPLTSIIGYSEIIQRMSGDEDVTLSAKYIQDAGQHLLTVVENIINISRFQRTEYEFSPAWFRLDELCQECQTLLLPRLERSGILLSCNCTSVEVYFDRERVREVLLNLLDNCILHSGCTRIAVSSATVPVRLIVEDNGEGIPPEQLERLFQPFYRPGTSAPGGSGLGLSICKEIMTAQGGDISVLSTPGSGTRVILYFQDPKEPQRWYDYMARRI